MKYLGTFLGFKIYEDPSLKEGEIRVQNDAQITNEMLDLEKRLLSSETGTRQGAVSSAIVNGLRAIGDAHSLEAADVIEQLGREAADWKERAEAAETVLQWLKAQLEANKPQRVTYFLSNNPNLLDPWLCSREEFRSMSLATPYLHPVLAAQRGTPGYEKEKAALSAIEQGTPRMDAALVKGADWVFATGCQLERELAYAVSKNHEEIEADRAMTRALASSSIERSDGPLAELRRIRDDTLRNDDPDYARMTAAIEELSARSTVEPNDYEVYRAFYWKHAMGSLMCPSCLLCGHQRHDRAEWSITHGELPDVYICKPCVDAARSVPPAIKRSEELAWLERVGGSVGRCRDAGLAAMFAAGDGKGNAGYGDTPEQAIRVLMRSTDGGRKDHG